MNTIVDPKSPNPTKLSKLPKPFLKWAGGKSALIPQLKKIFPQSCNNYFEPFLGSGSVFFYLYSTKKCFISDINADLIELYEVIRDNPQELMKILDSYTINYSSSFYYETRKKDPSMLSKTERSARMLFLNKTCFNGLYRVNKKGVYNVPWGKKVSCPNLYDRANILKVSSLLKNVHLSWRSFESITSMVQENDFIYCDPPYHPLNKTSSFTNYAQGGFTFSDHIHLRDTALYEWKKKGAHIAVSNSYTEEILKLYKDFKIYIINAPRMINTKSHLRGNIREVCCML